jgi:hypothetical protein
MPCGPNRHSDLDRGGFAIRMWLAVKRKSWRSLTGCEFQESVYTIDPFTSPSYSHNHIPPKWSSSNRRTSTSPKPSTLPARSQLSQVRSFVTERERTKGVCLTSRAGGSRGIGLDVSRGLAEAGADVPPLFRLNDSFAKYAKALYRLQ